MEALVGEYLGEFSGAFERTRRFNLACPEFLNASPRRHLTQKALRDFPYFVRDNLGELDLEEVVAQCMSIHHRIIDPIEEWLKCKAYYTIGWVSVGAQTMFKFDDDFIRSALSGDKLGKTINIHAWVTLDSLEIIDMSLSTSVGYIQKIPSMLGGAITMHYSDLKGMAYTPMLIGDDFLRRIGALIDLPDIYTFTR